MVTTNSKLDRVSELLDLILSLPLGHPDRLRFLTCAEQIFEEPAAGVVPRLTKPFRAKEAPARTMRRSL
jgi:hypothetical protein